MPIRTFRGFMPNDSQDVITLHTNNGSTGYRIVNFQIMGPDGNSDIEQVVKIYKTDHSADITTDIDFSDNRLLGAAIINDSLDRHYAPTPIVIFDKEVFNQDIYVTSKGHDNPITCNYYIELEQIKLDLNENTVATLKDMRNSTQQQ